MFDLFDLVSPRVYVISDSEYKEYKDRKIKAKIEYLESQKAEINKQIEALKG